MMKNRGEPVNGKKEMRERTGKNYWGLKIKGWDEWSLWRVVFMTEA